MGEMIKHESYLQPRTLDEAINFSKYIANSGMVPTQYRGKAEDVLCAIGYGAELGLGPFQALQGIVVINGHASLWGDAIIAMAVEHPECEDFKEWIEGVDGERVAYCEIKRRGRESKTKKQFSVKDAKRALLWSKKGPWQEYPEIMLQQRATCFAIRRAFPGALSGFKSVEEHNDYPEANIIDIEALSSQELDVEKSQGDQAQAEIDRADMKKYNLTEEQLNRAKDSPPDKETAKKKRDSEADLPIGSAPNSFKSITKKQQSEFVGLVASSGLGKAGAIQLLKENGIDKSSEIPADKFDHIRNEVVRLGREKKTDEKV